MKNIRIFLFEKFQFLEVKFSIYLNKHVFCNEKYTGRDPDSFNAYFDLTTLFTSFMNTCTFNIYHERAANQCMDNKRDVISKIISYNRITGVIGVALITNISRICV